jgi:hypothetical protein
VCFHSFWKKCLCSLNAQGSWHDSFTAENGGIYNKFEAIHAWMAQSVVVDSFFSVKQHSFLTNTGKKGRIKSS